MLIFLSWIIFSILVAVYANNKGRSGAGFFFLSLLLSPLIGFIIVAVSSPQREKVAERSGMKKCPACAEYVQGKALVCRFCGRKFGGVGADAEPWITTSDIEKIQRRLQVAKASSYSRPSVLDEGVVAKHRLGTYSARPASWFKILTGDYTQKRGRRELFESFRDRIELFRSASPKRT